MKFVFRISDGTYKFETQLRTSTLVVRVKLPFGRNTYLLFNSDIVDFVWKTDGGETESIVLLIFVLWWCFNRRWMRGVGVVQKVLFIRTS